MSPAESTHDPEFGMMLPDGTKPDPSAMLNANECWTELVDAVRPRGGFLSGASLVPPKRQLTFLPRRSPGPDATNSLIRHVQARPKTHHFEMRFFASILHMRGQQVVVQPFTAPNGDVFLWNGEIFDGLEVSRSVITRWSRADPCCE